MGGLLTVSFEDSKTEKVITTGGNADGVGISTNIGLGSFYNAASNPLVNGAGEVFKPQVASDVVFEGEIRGLDDGTCSVTLSSNGYTVTMLPKSSFTLSSVVICVDGGYSVDAEGNVAVPSLSNLSLSYTRATLSLQPPRFPCWLSRVWLPAAVAAKARATSFSLRPPLLPERRSFCSPPSKKKRSDASVRPFSLPCAGGRTNFLICHL